MEKDVCPICAQATPSNPFFIKKLQFATIVLDKDQFYKGRVRVILNRHAEDELVLSKEEADGFWNDCLTAAKAVKKAFNPAKLNYGLMGNADPHLHWHVRPRYLDDPYFKTNPWRHEQKKEITAEEAKPLIAAIGKALEK